MKRIVFGILGALGLVLVIGPSIFLGLFPSIIQKELKKELPFLNGSDAYKRWQKQPVPYTMKFWFLTVKTDKTNDNFHLDDLEFTEKGPYAYTEDKTRDVSHFSDDEKFVTYNDRNVFTFNPEQSGEGLKEDDDITVLNFPLLGMIFNRIDVVKNNVVNVVKLEDSIYKKAYSDPNGDLNETSLLLTTTPRDLIFDGVPYKLLKRIGLSVPGLVPEKFAILRGRDEQDEEMVVNTGKDNIKDIAQLISWNGKENLTNAGSFVRSSPWVWSTNDSKAETCNRLVGTDATMFAPDIQEEDVLDVFEPMLCRKVYFKYWKDSEVRSVSTMRFRIPSDFFESPFRNPDNKCYCIEKDLKLCDKNGVMEISHCDARAMGAPIVMSTPYFFNGDEEFRKAFKTELKAPKDLNDEHYGTYLDVDPISGTVLRGFKRTQMNLKILGSDISKELIQLNPRFKNIDTNKDYLVPVFFAEESAEANDKQVDELKKQLMNVIKLGKGLAIGGIVVGALMVIASVFLFIKYK